jgi:hypothetical protein
MDHKKMDREQTDYLQCGDPYGPLTARHFGCPNGDFFDPHKYHKTPPHKEPKKAPDMKPAPSPGQTGVA